MTDLEHHFGPANVAQPMLTELHDERPVRQRVAHQLLGHQRHDDLATVRRAHQPSRTVHRRTEIVTIPELSDTGMDPHTDAQRLRNRPWLVQQRQLGIDRSGDRGVGRREHRVNPVTRPLDELAAMRRDRLTQNRVMARQRLPPRFRLLFSKPRRHLQISEQERHRARRQPDCPLPSAVLHTANDINFVASWQPDDAEPERHKAWARTAWDAVQPFAHGVYVKLRPAIGEGKLSRQPLCRAC
jgi:hypothetical protein